LRRGCPIRISLDQNLLAVPQSFSQRATSFIASWCQGIHRMPFYRSIFALPKESHTHRHKTRTRFCSLPAMHRNHSSEPHNHYRKHLKKPAARYGRFQKTPTIKIPKKITMQTRIPCNIHGHHNRNHCTIIHLNTRKPPQL
jgi:hypothetical protein